jgi:acyl-CoA thioesterase-1
MIFLNRLIFAFWLSVIPFTGWAADQPLHIVALGDSLIAGYGLPAGQDYASQLEAALRKEGLNVNVVNGGVTGDTTADGRARLDGLLAGESPPRLVIVSLGANDMLRSLPPAETEGNLRAILQTLKNKKIPTVLYGMRAPFTVSAAYRKQFDAIYSHLEDEFDVELYPFFLKGVALDPRYTLADGVHPNAEGVAIMVKNTLPLIEDALDD